MEYFGTVHYHFYGYQDENFKMVNQEYRAWSDCMDDIHKTDNGQFQKWKVDFCILEIQQVKVWPTVNQCSLRYTGTV